MTIELSDKQKIAVIDSTINEFLNEETVRSRLVSFLKSDENDLLEVLLKEIGSKCVAKSVDIEPFVKEFEYSEILENVSNDDIMKYCNSEGLIDESATSFNFNGVKSMKHDQLLEKLQECFDKFVNPDLIIQSLEKLCK